MCGPSHMIEQTVEALGGPILASGAPLDEYFDGDELRLTWCACSLGGAHHLGHCRHRIGMVSVAHHHESQSHLTGAVGENHL
eukprot:3896914-Amphidinium_carterae.1